MGTDGTLLDLVAVGSRCRCPCCEQARHFVIADRRELAGACTCSPGTVETVCACDFCRAARRGRLVPA